MRRAGGRTVPRRCSSLLAGVALAGAVALVGGPAYGQLSGVDNGGNASAATGANTSAGNGSTNVAGTSGAATTPAGSSSEPLLGGLLGLVLNVGGSNTANTSSGTSAVTTGGANSSGNNSDTSVDQASVGGGDGGRPVGRPGPVGIGGPGVIGTVFSPFIGPTQLAGVSNDGTAAASTGGNASTGNGSTNAASTNQTVTGGLIAAGINLGGGNASNVSNGSSAINTGPANAAGNTSTSAINQDRLGAGFRVGGGAVCDGLFRFSGQLVDVSNTGSADASTGDNASVGNASTNVATADSNVSGGLIGLGVNLTGQNASNASDGQSAVGTGAANAAGNRSTTAVDQQCVQPAAAFPGPPVITPVVVRQGIGGPGVPGVVVQGQLARTGVDPFVMGLIAFSLLFGGLLFMVWERVEALPAGGRRPRRLGHS